MTSITHHNQVWVLLPVKQFAHAKQRLAPWLELNCPIESADLARAMLCDVLGALRQSQMVDRISVVTSQSQVEHLLPEAVHVIPEGANAGLNPALTVGLGDLRRRGIRHCAILPADIPLLDHEELDNCLDHYLACCADHGPDSITIVPSHDKDGTNMLCLNPQDPIPLGYGHGSYKRHVQLALASGKHIRTLSAESIARDIDTATDLNELLKSCHEPEKSLAASTCRLLSFKGYSAHVASTF